MSLHLISPHSKRCFKWFFLKANVYNFPPLPLHFSSQCADVAGATRAEPPRPRTWRRARRAGRGGNLRAGQGQGGSPSTRPCAGRRSLPHFPSPRGRASSRAAPRCRRRRPVGCWGSSSLLLLSAGHHSSYLIWYLLLVNYLPFCWRFCPFHLILLEFRGFNFS